MSKTENDINELADFIQQMTYEGLADISDYISIAVQDLVSNSDTNHLNNFDSKYFSELLLEWADLSQR